jgi:DNA-binding transcriptional regulator YiaG
MNISNELPTKEELRAAAIRELIAVNRDKKELQDRALQLLFTLSDSEKTGKVLDIVDKLHKGILDDVPDLDVLIEELLAPEELELFNQARNSHFSKGVEVFEKYKEHPVQKKMQKVGCIGRRKVKKGRTPIQHIGIMIQAKEFYELKRRVETLEELSKVHSEEIRTLTELSGADTSLLSGTLSTKKIAFKKVLEQNPNLTRKQLSAMFGISERTVYNWKEELNTVVFTTTQG